MIQCSPKFYTDAISLSSDLHLTGPIPLAVTLLQNLTEIDLDGNNLVGPVSPYLGCLPNLVEVDFANNSLWGSIPAEWRFMSRSVSQQ